MARLWAARLHVGAENGENKWRWPEQDGALVAGDGSRPNPGGCGGKALDGGWRSMARPLVVASMTPFPPTPPEVTPIPARRPCSILELDIMVLTRCSTLCFDDDMGVLPPMF